jgi:hypothetical protein
MQHNYPRHPVWCQLFVEIRLILFYWQMQGTFKWLIKIQDKQILNIQNSRTTPQNDCNAGAVMHLGSHASSYHASKQGSMIHEIGYKLLNLKENVHTNYYFAPKALYRVFRKRYLYTFIQL